MHILAVPHGDAPLAIGGTLSVVDSVGNLTQTGVLTVTGTSSFATSASSGAKDPPANGQAQPPTANHAKAAGAP